jgi:hypothetical protein
VLRFVAAPRANRASQLEDERRDIVCRRFPRLHRSLAGPTDPVRRIGPQVAALEHLPAAR